MLGFNHPESINGFPFLTVQLLPKVLCNLLLRHFGQTGICRGYSTFDQSYLVHYYFQLAYYRLFCFVNVTR